MKTISVWLLILALSLSGCSDGQTLPTAGVSKKRADRPWHEKFNWVAEDYFEDPQVIALCKAIEANDLEEIEKLVKAGADVNAQGKGKMTPLLWAFPDGHLPRFQKLLELGADPNVVVESNFDTKGGIHKGHSVTHMAAATHFGGYFEQVMQHGGDVHLVDEGSHGDTLLHTVIMKAPVTGRKKRIRLLLDQEINIDAQNKSYQTPLSLAVGWGAQYDIALMLLKAGANPKIYGYKSNSKLIHTVARERDNLGTTNNEAQKNFDEIVRILERQYGESLEQAQKDNERWMNWGRIYSPAKCRKLIDAEIAQRVAREEAAAQTNPANKAARDN